MPPVPQWFRRLCSVHMYMYIIGPVHVQYACLMSNAPSLSISQSQLKEVVVPYTHCNASYPNPSTSNCSLPFTFPTCAEYIRNLSSLSNVERNTINPCPCFCNIRFEIPQDMGPTVNVYYQMSNFYQNHRRYVNSWDVGSLRGDGISESHSDCDPLNTNGSISYYPCGLIANSNFNGRLTSLVQAVISVMCVYMCNHTFYNAHKIDQETF